MFNGHGVTLRQNNESMRFFLSVFSFIAVIHIPSAFSIFQCPIETSSGGGGVCPNRTKCCAILSRDGSSLASGCIPHNNHYPGDGDCCDYADEYDKPGLGSACVGQFKCSNSTTIHATSNEETSETSFFCSLDVKDEHGNITTLTMPRYKLIESSVEQLTVHGFPILTWREQQQQQLNPYVVKEHVPVMAYYSNRETPFTEINTSLDENIQAVVITIHGSGRNADEYLYAAMVVTQLQQKYNPKNVLVIAPRFLAPEDAVDSLPVKTKTNNNSVVEMVKPLMWNETYPIPHTWRYGARALPPWSNLTSYDVVDGLVEYFALQQSGEGTEGGQHRFPNLKRIAVIGHSAGGQFVHRWALTSNSQAWDHSNSNKSERGANDIQFDMTTIVDTSVAASRSRQLRRLNDYDFIDQRSYQQSHKYHHRYQQNLPLIRVVAANPRSYCYLDERRFLNGTFQVPPLPMRENCTFYNSWQWGLDDGGSLPTPYRDRAIDFFHGNRTKLALRYAKRDVIYLAGNNDTGLLEGSCQDDDFQGKFRRERSENFFMSLKYYFGYQVHLRLVVDSVGHDHSLMFGSEEGIQAIFG